MRILCEVFGLFDKRGASGGGTPYIIRGAWGLGADKGAAERRLTGGRKYAPKGNGKDEKEKKEPAKGKRKREKGERRITNGWAQICAQRERKGRKGEKKACKRKKKERKGRKRWEGERQKEKKACKRRKKKKKKERKKEWERHKNEKRGANDPPLTISECKFVGCPLVIRAKVNVKIALAIGVFAEQSPFVNSNHVALDGRVSYFFLE